MSLLKKQRKNFTNNRKKWRTPLAKLNGNEYIGTATHEQYFYPDYFNYQPDYAEKYYTLGKILKEYGYRFITVDEMK